MSADTTSTTVVDDGLRQVDAWYEAEARAEALSQSATRSMRDAISLSTLSLREIARQSKLSAAALSQVMSGRLDNLSSHATWRVLEVCRAALTRGAP